MKSVLLPEHIAYIALHLFVKRVTVEPNMHNVYLHLLDSLKIDELQVCDLHDIPSIQKPIVFMCGLHDRPKIYHCSSVSSLLFFSMYLCVVCMTDLRYTIV